MFLQLGGRSVTATCKPTSQHENPSYVGLVVYVLLGTCQQLKYKRSKSARAANAQDGSFIAGLYTDNRVSAILS